MTPSDLVYQGQTGLWALHTGTDEWRAWRYWLAKEFARTFFGREWLTVPKRWPPVSPREAEDVAMWVASMREGVRGAERVNPAPRPWDGHTPGPDEQPRDPHDPRPLTWWCQAMAQWKPHWKLEDVSSEWREIARIVHAKREAAERDSE